MSTGGKDTRDMGGMQRPWQREGFVGEGLQGVPEMVGGTHREFVGF